MDLGASTISASGTVAKQRQQFLESMASKFVKDVEKAILSEVDFSGALHGKSSVELDQGQIGHFIANFDTGDEIISKKFGNVMAVNEWLLSMARSYKSGSLSKSIRQVERSVASGVKLDKATLKLADTQTLSLEEAVSTLQSTSALPKDIAECQDVTASFLETAKDPQVDLPGSSICVHKGSYNTFATTTAANPNISAILLGKNAWNDKFHVTQMVLSAATPTDMLQHEKIIARCEVQRLKPCGLILVGEAGQLHEENNVKSTLEPFKPGHPTPILISIDFSQKATGIYFASQLNAETGTVQRVSLSWATQPRAEGSQRLSYNICHLSELGVSHYDKAAEKIALAVVKQVQTKMSSDVDASAKHGPLVLFRKVNTVGGTPFWQMMISPNMTRSQDQLKQQLL